MATTAQTTKEHNVQPVRPKGPCDIYVAASDPCVAAYSTTGALPRRVRPIGFTKSIRETRADFSKPPAGRASE